MADARGEPVLVSVALVLRSRYPDTPALSILDAVFARVEVRERARVLDDWTSPWLIRTTPFAALVNEAFDGRPIPFIAGNASSIQKDGSLRPWNDVLQQLHDRYRHQPPAVPDSATSH